MTETFYLAIYVLTETSSAAEDIIDRYSFFIQHFFERDPLFLERVTMRTYIIVITKQLFASTEKLLLTETLSLAGKAIDRENLMQVQIILFVNLGSFG